MPVVIEDCSNLFSALAPRFPLLKGKTVDQLQRLDPPRGVTAAFLVRPSGIVQPLVFVFFPHDHDEWQEVARQTFDFEGECWLRWAENLHSTTVEMMSFRRHNPPPVWVGLREQRDENGVHLIGRHEAPISRLNPQGRFPVLVRPYIPWMPLDVSGSLAPMRAHIERVVNPIVQTARRPLDAAIRDLQGSHLLAQDGRLVPTRWRVFHERFFGLGLSREERRERWASTTPRQ